MNKFYLSISVRSELRCPSASGEFEGDTQISDQTITDYMTYFRSVICNYMLDERYHKKIGSISMWNWKLIITMIIIGGPGLTVEALFHFYSFITDF